MSTASVRITDDMGREVSLHADASGVFVDGGKGGVKMDFPFGVSADKLRVSRPVMSFMAEDGAVVIVEGFISNSAKMNGDVEIRIERKNGNPWFTREKLPRVRIFVDVEEKPEGGSPKAFLKVSVLGGNLESEVVVASAPLVEEPSPVEVLKVL